MNQHTPPSMPASSAQIAEALEILFKSMRFHPGVDPDKALFGYMQALQGYSIAAIATGIRKFLRGECEGVNPKFCPHPPELAQIVRTAVVRSQLPPPQPSTPGNEELPGAQARMRLKMPLYAYAYKNGRMDELAAANKAGFGAMVVLATNWGVPIPQDLLDRPDAEDEWRRAHNRAWAEIERNPPPFMRTKRWQDFKSRQAAE